jgi:hypothetical protein
MVLVLVLWHFFGLYERTSTCTTVPRTICHVVPTSSQTSRLCRKQHKRQKVMENGDCGTLEEGGTETLFTVARRL